MNELNGTQIHDHFFRSSELVSALEHAGKRNYQLYRNQAASNSCAGFAFTIGALKPCSTRFSARLQN
jgi:hypothetical protein